MSIINIVPSVTLAPFKDAMGSHYDKICNDTKAFLGREEKNTKQTDGKAKVSDKCIITQSNGVKLALPLNSPYSILIRFGQQLTAIAEKGNFDGSYKLSKDGKTVEHCGLQCGIPAAVETWFQKSVKESSESEVSETESEAKAEVA